MGDFLAVELATGRTFVRMAFTSGDLRKKDWYIGNAWKAYDTILRFIGRANLNEKQKARFGKGMCGLRVSLEQLGEKVIQSLDDDAELITAQPVRKNKEPFTEKGNIGAMAERVRLFEMDCRQFREHANFMLEQNHDLMNRKHAD